MITRPWAGALSIALMMTLIACGDSSITERDRPSDRGGDFDGIATVDSALTICMSASDCLADEACTQGGHCVNITGDRDATAAIQADLDALPPAVGMGTPYRLPENATLRISDITGDGVGLRVDDKIIFEGRGSLLVVENGIIGIRVGQPSEWSLFRDFRINSHNGHHVHDGIGIDIRAHGVRLDNILMWRMGTGVRAHTYLGDDYANVNKQQWSRLVFRGIHHRALDLRGGDANAGLISGVEVIGSAGIYDRSFLGNTYVAPALEGTWNNSLTLASNAGRHLILGAYVELGDPNPTSASAMDLHVGGNSIARLEGPGDRIGYHSSFVRFRHPESGMTTRIPGSPDAAFAWRHPQEDEWWFLRYWDHPAWLKWGISYRNSGTAPLYWTGADHSQGPAQLELGNTLQ